MTNRIRRAPGGPGIPPRWTGSAKDGVGTAYSGSSRIWFTVSLGILNEIYFPTIDQPQVRDLQFLVTDGESFFHDERQLNTAIDCLPGDALGFRMTNSDPEGRYQIRKEIIANPYQACILMRTEFLTEATWKEKLRLFILCAPHLDVGGWGNSARVISKNGIKLLVAQKNEKWLALAATIPFGRTSVGYVGVNDGWQDLNDNFQMDYEYEAVEDGNIALTGELESPAAQSFTVGLSLADTRHQAITTLFQSLGFPFERHRSRFMRQWRRVNKDSQPLDQIAGDGGRLYRVSQNLLRSHEDKTYQGAMIASLSIPWGNIRGDDDVGGYHLVWTRDMVQSANGLLAAGHRETPLRALMYLAACQLPDGGFHQNFWLDGEPFWTGIQLDEVAFPIILAWKLSELEALEEFDPYPMVTRAARYLIKEGPVTPQERWEEASGLSPSTLASNIAALVCAAAMAETRSDSETAGFFQDYADFLERHVEQWTVTDQGSLLEGMPRHYVRINPADHESSEPIGDPNHGDLIIANRPPGSRYSFPARDVVDAGFLELVRYGIRAASDPLIIDSLKVVDAVLKVNTPKGPCWRRYNHDGYGQQADGGPFVGYGVGRAWPLLTGERGHYELAAGGDVAQFVRTMERFAHECGLLPEQVWDEEDLPDQHLFKGCPTGAAMPLMWAHSEYIRLLRSARDGEVFDRIPVVAKRYLERREPKKNLQIWKPNRRVEKMVVGQTLRVQAPEVFHLRWSLDDWSTIEDEDSQSTPVGLYYVDIPVAKSQDQPIKFTIYWSKRERWERRDYSLDVLKR